MATAMTWLVRLFAILLLGIFGAVIFLAMADKFGAAASLAFAFAVVNALFLGWWMFAVLGALRAAVSHLAAIRAGTGQDAPFIGAPAPTRAPFGTARFKREPTL